LTIAYKKYLSVEY